MGCVTIKIEEALARYHDAVQEVMAKLAKGKSKHRDIVDPAALQWEISYAVKVDSRVPIKYGNTEGRVADLVSNTVATLQARIGRWWGSSDILAEVPDEVVRLHRMHVEDDEATRRRFAAMSPREQAEEQAKILRQLSATKGFMIAYSGGGDDE